MDVQTMKKEAGVKKFVSLFGRSTIDATSSDYVTIKDITTCLLQNGFGVVHGGYNGGAMQAVSEAASEYIAAHGLSPFRNIAVPQTVHDKSWPRVSQASFADVSADIYDRLKVITASSMSIVLPQGGFGTNLEWTVVFHENHINENLGLPVQPLIFFQTKTGTDWKNLVNEILEKLNLEPTVGKNWLYFVHTIPELEDLILKLKKIKICLSNLKHLSAQ